MLNPNHKFNYYPLQFFIITLLNLSRKANLFQLNVLGHDQRANSATNKTKQLRPSPHLLFTQHLSAITNRPSSRNFSKQPCPRYFTTCQKFRLQYHTITNFKPSVSTTFLKAISKNINKHIFYSIQQTHLFQLYISGQH